MGCVPIRNIITLVEEAGEEVMMFEQNPTETQHAGEHARHVGARPLQGIGATPRFSIVAEIAGALRDGGSKLTPRKSARIAIKAYAQQAGGAAPPSGKHARALRISDATPDSAAEMYVYAKKHCSTNTRSHAQGLRHHTRASAQCKHQIPQIVREQELHRHQP